MKYGYIAFGKLKQDIFTGENINKAMDAVKKVAEKHEVKIKMYGYPYGVSENFVVVYASDKGLDDFQSFSSEANLQWTDVRTHQVLAP
jgi:hypothetical protein